MVASIVPTPGPTIKEYAQQSIEVPNTRKDGQTGHYRHPKWSDLTNYYGKLTLPELFESGRSHGPSQPFLGHREIISKDPLKYAADYTWQSYSDVDKRRRAIGTALEKLFRDGTLAKGPEFETVGIWAPNRPEWQVVDLACHAYNKVGVALFDTLGYETAEYIINHASLPIVFCSGKHVKELLDYSPRCPTLKMVVSFDDLEASEWTKLVEAGKERGVDVRTMDNLEKEYSKDLLELIPATLDQVAAICYTSGTTSTPKGVVFSHLNISSSSLCYMQGAPGGQRFPPNFAFFSYLPLPHSYGRVVELAVCAAGGRIGYSTGNVLNLISDVQACKPHYFPAVPRILNKIYFGAMQAAKAPGVKGFLFRRAVATKLANLEASGALTHKLWDALVFKKIQALLGGRVLAISSGGAPVIGDTMNFMRIAFACDVVEGYGLTETCACGTRTWPDDPSALSGTIGGPAHVNEVKLIDVKDLNYMTTDIFPRGEICIRGDNVFQRYYRDEAKTAEVLDEEGWVHTGDVAELDSIGRFRIIDRIKNIVKLQQGEYVALEKIENLYQSCPLVSQIYVHADPFQDHLVAIVVPDPIQLSATLEQAGLSYEKETFDATAAVKDPQVTEAVLKSLTTDVRKSGDLQGFEVVKAIYLTTEEFDVPNDTMTPTFKIKRRQAYEKHKANLEALYPSKPVQGRL